MGSILYYIPGRAGIKRDIIASAGLSHIMLAQGAPSQVQTAGGPAGNGIYFWFGEGTAPAAVAEAGKERWRPVGTAKALCTFDPEDPPGPLDLARECTLQGHDTNLADGNLWTIPIIRFAMEGDLTPLDKRLDKVDGVWVETEVLPEYRGLFDHACRAWEQFYNAREGDDGVDITDGYELAAAAMGLNYRVSAVEINLLGLFSKGTAQEACLAAIDYPRWRDYLQKKEGILAGLSAMPGGGD